MSMLFLKWEEDAVGEHQALFSEGSHVVAFTEPELLGPLGRLYNTDWLLAVEAALATHPRLRQMTSKIRPDGSADPMMCTCGRRAAVH